MSFSDLFVAVMCSYVTVHMSKKKIKCFSNIKGEGVASGRGSPSFGLYAKYFVRCCRVVKEDGACRSDDVVSS